MPKNKFKVPKQQWRRWGPVARDVFNRLYVIMKHDQDFFMHPQAAAYPKRYWKTTAWNAAWMAADFAEEAHEEAHE